MNLKRKFPPNWEEDAEKIRAERSALHDEWIRKRLQLEADCRYGTEQYTPQEMQRAVWLQCRNDIFFFISYFCWTLDPRERSDRQDMPFILYEYQVDFVKWFIAMVTASIGRIDPKNLVVEKSRDMGVSWLLVVICVWYLLFHNAIMCVGSRKEEECDKLGDMSTFLEKCRYIIRRLPDYLLPEGFDQEKHMGFLLLRNPKGGQIEGESANPQFGRGPRNLFTIYDEFAVWDHDEAAWKSGGGSTNVRVAVFTPNGPFNKAAQLANPDKWPGTEKCEKKTLHWILHPIKAAGLIKDEFGRWTSPWYEGEKRRFSEEDIASELDICYEKSSRGLVFSEYTEDHQKDEVEPEPGRTVVRIWDPGLTFFVLFMMVDRWNRVLALRELCMEDANIHEVAQSVLAISAEFYADHQIVDCGDPAGKNRVNSGQEAPEYTVLAEQYGIDVDYDFLEETQTQMRVKNRITAIKNKLIQYEPHTRTPSLLVDTTNCPKLHRALKEQYRYKVSKYSKQVLPQIDEFHPAEDAVDCLGYGILYRCGLGLATTSRSSTNRVTVDKNGIEWDQLRRSS